MAKKKEKKIKTTTHVVEKVVFDNKDKRPDICLRIDGENHWFPRDEISISGKKVTMPAWLSDLKL